eukprot:1641089-Prorocentrum_lima.AAC.1
MPPESLGTPYDLDAILGWKIYQGELIEERNSHPSPGRSCCTQTYLIYDHPRAEERHKRRTN